MKEYLKRDLNKTYLILSGEEEFYEESYEIEMIMKNTPKTILPMHALRMDGELQLFYDVSSKQSLKDCAERAKLAAGTVQLLFEAICELKKEVKDYLLDMENILLDLEHIYTKEGTFYFCYCPWKNQDILDAFRNMLEQILGNLDYRDTKGVELTYHLYQCACSGNFQISEILQMHSEKECKEPEQEKAAQASEWKEPKEEVYEEERWTEKSEKQEMKKPSGILGKLISFFMKKPEDREELKEQEDCWEGTEDFQTGVLAGSCTEVLRSSVNESTVLLASMPKGKWKLRPQMQGYEEFCIEGERFLVGKKKGAVDGMINRETISRIHSRLFVRQDRLYISDANSTNGTFVNGRAIEPGEEIEILEGDRILFADVGYECYNSL